jgi:hypothetical protein
MSAKKTWLQRRVEWLENHRFWSRVLFAALVLGAIGGIFSFVEKAVELGQQLFRQDASEIRIHVEVQNARSNSVQIEPVCTFEVVETTRSYSSAYFGLGERARLSPVGSFTGTNAYFLKPGGIRAYQIRLPNSQLARDLIDREATQITTTGRRRLSAKETEAATASATKVFPMPTSSAKMTPG